eukprot:TRINITY_DN6164_c0_g4_i1.p1 TRINITY_DN6164_c0_g4~~TRINITY_DN6164_c0_g4_i1.p1  ORF type:complete len:103 (-),score=4.84 TRINITY_DN6164_c0_g4_i1:106-414(-)
MIAMPPYSIHVAVCSCTQIRIRPCIPRVPCDIIVVVVVLLLLLLLSLLLRLLVFVSVCVLFAVCSLDCWLECLFACLSHAKLHQAKRLGAVVVFVVVLVCIF